MNWRFVGYLAIALVVIHIPVIGPFFQIVNTLIHESSHAIVSLLLRGEVLQIQLFANTEGVTYTASSSYIAIVLTSGAGYTGSAIAAYVLAVLYAKGKHTTSLWLFAAVAIMNLILWVRNPFGMIWLILFIGLLLFALRRRGSQWSAVLSFGLLVFVLAESISSSFTILWVSLFHPAEAGDAANLARMTYLPAGFWGAVFMLISGILGYLSARKLLWRRGSRNQ